MWSQRFFRGGQGIFLTGFGVITKNGFENTLRRYKASREEVEGEQRNEANVIINLV